MNIVCLRYCIYCVFLYFSFGNALGPCEDFFKPKDETKTVNTENYTFKKSIKEEIYAYVILFTFSGKVNNLKVFSTRESVRVNDTTWVVIKNDNYIIHHIDFTLQIKFGAPVEIDSIFYNGQLICKRESSSESQNRLQVAGNTSSSKEIITNTVILIITIAIICLLGVVLRSIVKLQEATDRHWYKTHSLALSIERGLSENNPNMKGVPLPEVPEEGGDKPFNKRGTYIDLRTYDRKNPTSLKTYSVMINAAQRIQEGVENESESPEDGVHNKAFQQDKLEIESDHSSSIQEETL